MNIHAPAFTRRRFLRALGQAGLLAALPARFLAEDGGAVTVSILHTTDLHGHILPTIDYNDHPDLGGLARCATQIRQWQRTNANSILLDIGDVYQGTEVGLRAQGATMIRCLNALSYDAWVIGNHEFDWGMDPFTNAVGLSAMPVLSANALIMGKPVGSLDGATGPLWKIKPWLLKEVAGFRIVVIGLTTPALSSWLPPENLRGFESLDPVESLRGILREVKALQPDAVVLAGHMGLIRRDDYANRIGTLTREFPDLVVCIGGHTHQNHSSEMINGVLYTQADHYGLYAGKIDLTFDRATRRLLKREAITLPMNHTVALDPLVLSVARDDLAASDLVLARTIGELTEPFSVATAFGEPSDVERFIGSAMVAALRKQNCAIDVVVHGLFDTVHPLPAGMKTIADIWTVLPYENEIVTVDLSHDDLLALASDFGSGRETRNIMGITVIGSSSGGRYLATDLRTVQGTPLSGKSTYRVALNSYDSQSGGQRFPVVAKLVAQSSNNRILHPIQIRDALIDFFVTRQKVSKTSLLV